MLCYDSRYDISCNLLILLICSQLFNIINTCIEGMGNMGKISISILSLRQYCGELWIYYND